MSIAQPLLAPTGYGVASIPVTSAGSGYLDTPVVVISGGSGSNATARATVSGGAVTGIVITSPGVDYASSDGLSATLYGGGGSGATLGTPVLSGNTSGGFTKLGAGTLTLMGANTYSGNTTVSNGMILVTPLHQVSGAVAISNNAGFGVQASSSSTATVGNLTLGTSLSASNILAFGINLGGANPTVPLLQAGTLILNGTNTLVRLSGQFAAGSFPLLRYSGTVQGAGSFNTNLLVPQGAAATLSNDSAHSTLYVNVSIGASGLVWTGTNSALGQANVWGLNAITNWLAGSTPAIYQESLPPGDAVNFTDTGSGTVLLSNTVSPSAVVFNNSSVSYTLSGSGHIAGGTGLIKKGAGTVTVNVTNTYTGNTAISNGTYVVGNAAAIPNGSGTGSLILAPLGALDVAGIGATANGFFGSGAVNNSSGTATTLTVGSGDGAGIWSGAIDSAASGGGLSLTKVGTNTLVVTGTNYLRSGTASQVNGGTMIITNGALVSMPSAEFWVAQNANTLATVIVDGGTLVTSNNWLVVGRNANTANGTLIVNHGAAINAGTNNIVVGSLGATGTLIVNGWQVLNKGMLWLGENATANGYLYLNGGLVQATQVRPNGTKPTNSIAYFNGGTLQATAGSTNFFAGTTLYVQRGGLVFDDGGYQVTNATQWMLEDSSSTGGGFVKMGAGAFYQDVDNYYSGTTQVANGTLAGIGSFVGPVVVGPAGNLGAGDSGATVGALSAKDTLTLQGYATLRVGKNAGVLANDVINVSSILYYGGTLVINNIGPDALAVGDFFTLFNAAGGSTGNFTGISGFPGAGLAYSFDPATGVLSVVAGGPPTTPTNLSFTVSGGTLHLSWAAEYKGWILQSQTNGIGVGITTTNWHDVAGSDALIGTDMPANPANGSVFYRLRYP